MPVPALSRFVKRCYSSRGLVSRIVTKLTDAYVRWRVADDCKRMAPFLKEHAAILDIGTGGAMVYKYLQAQGHSMTGVDVVDLSMYPGITPVIYNGSKLEFPDKSFDAAILDRVLHHCGNNQEAVLTEALRCARRVLIVEDVYRNGLEKLMVAFNDSMANWEWHQHRYRDMAGWERLIQSLGGRVMHQEFWLEVPQWSIYTPHALFVAERREG